MTLRLLVLRTLRWLVSREMSRDTPADASPVMGDDHRIGSMLLEGLDEQINTEEIEEELLGSLGQPMPVWSPTEPERPPVVEGKFKEKEKESDD